MHRNRKFAVIALLICCLGLSGCVYLRLLEVKKQLAKFDKYFEVEVTDSFTLHLNDPVIYDSDILYLTELNPSRTVENNKEKEFVYHFVKVEETPAPGNHDLIFTLSFNEKKKLDTLVFSPIILKIVPARFLELSIRAVGHGKVDRGKRQLKGDVDKVAQEGLEIPTYDKMIAVMGEPYEIVQKPDGKHAIFRYLLKTDSVGGKSEDRKKAVVDMRFDEQTKQLIKVSGNFAGMKISVNYSRLVKQENQS